MKKNLRTHFLRRAAWTLAALTGGLVLLLFLTAGVLFWAYKNPQEAFALVEKHFLPSDLKITWSAFDFKSHRLTGLDFEIDLAIDHLRVRKESPSLDVPLDRARLYASVSPFPPRARLHLVEAVATEPVVFRSDADAPPSPAKNPFQQIQGVIRILELIHDRTPVEAVDARLAKFVYQSGDGKPLEMALEIKQPKNQPLAASFSMNGTGGNTFSVSADAKLDFSKMKTSENFLSGLARFRGYGVVTEQNVNASFNDGRANISLAGPVEFVKGKMRLILNPKLEASFTEREAILNLLADIKGIPGPLVRVDRARLELTTPLDPNISWSRKPSKFKLSAPIELFFVDRPRRKIMEKSCGCKLPEVIAGEAKGEIWLSSLLSKADERRPVLTTTLSFESLRNKIFSIDLAADLKMEVEGGGKLETKYFFSPHLNCSATVHSFQSVRPLLDSKNILIPAPFDVLEGTLSFKADGPIATTDVGSKFPLNLSLDLNSKSQRVKGETTADIEINPQFTEAHVDVRARVESLILDLPPLEPLDGLPRIAGDSRFLKEPPRKKQAPKFKVSFNFEVETTAPDSIRLKSHYFAPYLPVNLKIQSSAGGDNTGYIQIEPFNITYLRRTVHVENLRMTLDGSDKPVYPVKGRFRVKQTDYTIFIDVEGTTKKPAVTMSSEPYLPKDEIISVLLYDRTSDQLIAGDAETAGGVQAAIADRAIGLFGLWAFASTPIRSFSYNPVTKVYAATLAVSDDLTAGVGTNWEEAAHLELRKRVSKRWSLTAAYAPATQDEGAVSKLVLQWEKRF